MRTIVDTITGKRPDALLRSVMLARTFTMRFSGDIRTHAAFLALLRLYYPDETPDQVSRTPSCTRNANGAAYTSCTTSLQIETLALEYVAFSENQFNADGFFEFFATQVHWPYARHRILQLVTACSLDCSLTIARIHV